MIDPELWLWCNRQWHDDAKPLGFMVAGGAIIGQSHSALWQPGPLTWHGGRTIQSEGVKACELLLSQPPKWSRQYDLDAVRGRCGYIWELCTDCCGYPADCPTCDGWGTAVEHTHLVGFGNADFDQAAHFDRGLLLANLAPLGDGMAKFELCPTVAPCGTGAAALRISTPAWTLLQMSIDNPVLVVEFN